MGQAAEFRRVAILGAGLIGASFAAAIEKQWPGVSIAAFDKPEVLGRLRAGRPRWEVTARPADAVRNAQLIYVALPVATAIQVLHPISEYCNPSALITDAGSTKAEICKAAREVFRGKISFVGGHPIAGKEVGGFEHATADLFCGKRYALMTDSGDAIQTDPRVLSFLHLLRAIGAEPLWMESEAHDRTMAAVSQMPQLVAVALAGLLFRGASENRLPLSLSGTGLRDMLRTAGSPYEIWRDICATNRENVAQFLGQIGREIELLREHLTSSELEIKFREANRLYEMLQRSGPLSPSGSPAAPESFDQAGVNG